MSFNHSNGWDKPTIKTAEQLNKSSQAQREEVINNYVNTLDNLEAQIKDQRIKFEAINKDIQQIHQKRMDQYDSINAGISMRQQNLDKWATQLENKAQALDTHEKELNDAIIKETQRVNSHNAAFLAKQDQLESTRKELDEYAQVQIKVSQEHAVINEEHKKRAADLYALTIDMNTATDKMIAQHHELKSAIEEHNNKVLSHKEVVDQLTKDQQKNFDFYNSLLQIQKELEPLKQQYLDGIDLNNAEVKRLRDANIESYALKQDAEKRIKEAQTAEAKALIAAQKLEALKTEIHSKIT